MNTRNESDAGDAADGAAPKAQLDATLTAASTAAEPAAQAAPPLSTAAPYEPPVPVPRRLAWALVAVVTLVAAAGYAVYGTPDYRVVAAQAKAEADKRAQAQAQAQQPPDAAQMDEILAKLVERLKTQPDDLTGWTMLGRATMVMGRFDQAVDAYQKALALKPDDPRLMTDYAEALGMQRNRSLEGEPTQLLDKALALDANLGKALALSGAAAFDRKDYPTAVKHWEKLVSVSPPDAEYLEQVRSGISEARQLAGMPASTVAPAGLPASTVAPGAAVAQAAPAAPAAQALPAAPAAAGALPSIRGTVTLSAALAAQARPEDTVFVLARPVEGSRMPLAIMRGQVKDLPLQFTLDDSMAMSPQSKLSSVPQVLVVARISKSGMATPSPGDLLGQSAPVSLGASGVKVEIGELVK